MNPTIGSLVRIFSSFPFVAPLSENPAVRFRCTKENFTMVYSNKESIQEKLLTKESSQSLSIYEPGAINSLYWGWETSNL